MLIFKYICFVIALFSSLFLVNSIISDLLVPPALKAIALNETENDVIQRSARLKFWLMLIMALTWPVIALF